MIKKTVKKTTTEEYVEGELVKRIIEEVTEEEDYSIPPLSNSSYKPPITPLL